MYAIETQDLIRIYQTESGTNVQAINGVSLQLEKGYFFALKGRSGSGKTTLLNCIGGLDTPTSGKVTIFGEDILAFGQREKSRWRRNKIGFVFQSFGLMPTLSAYENIELVLRLQGTATNKRLKKVWGILDQVGLKKWVNHRPFEMSGGQQQRVAVARALVNDPQLLIADEPTGELDTETAREIFDLFRKISVQNQLTIIAATHDDLINEFADSIITLEDGKVESIESILQNQSSKPSHNG